MSDIEEKNNYIWKKDDRFEITGEELFMILSILKNIVMSERGNEVLTAYKLLTDIEKRLPKEVS